MANGASDTIKSRGEFEFVSLVCADGLELDAFWVSPQSPRAVVIHIHGKGGNFYHNKFLRSMYFDYPARGIAVLGINTRGNASIAEASRSGQVIYVGSARERLADCLLDIRPAVDFAAQRADCVVLQGHSYGCDKVLYFARMRHRLPSILISPANSVLLQEAYRRSSPSISDATVNLNDSAQIKLASAGSYGVRTERQVYDIPIEPHVLAEILEDDDLRLFDFRRPAPEPVDGRSLIMLGGADDLQLGRVREMADFCGQLFTDAIVKISASANHHFAGEEHALCAEAVGWIDGLTAQPMLKGQP